MDNPFVHSLKYPVCAIRTHPYEHHDGTVNHWLTDKPVWITGITTTKGIEYEHGGHRMFLGSLWNDGNWKLLPNKDCI